MELNVWHKGEKCCTATIKRSPDQATVTDLKKQVARQTYIPVDVSLFSQFHVGMHKMVKFKGLLSAFSTL